MTKKEAAELRGVRLEDLLGGERTIDVRFGQRSLSVTYDPRRVRTTMIDTESGNQHELARAVADVVSAWDLVKPDGEPWRPELPEAADVPIAILSRVLRAVVQDQQADPK